jgi:hypothetical protein
MRHSMSDSAGGERVIVFNNVGLARFDCGDCVGYYFSSQIPLSLQQLPLHQLDSAIFRPPNFCFIGRDWGVHTTAEGI